MKKIFFWVIGICVIAFGLIQAGTAALGALALIQQLNVNVSLSLVLLNLTSGLVCIFGGYYIFRVRRIGLFLTGAAIILREVILSVFIIPLSQFKIGPTLVTDFLIGIIMFALAFILIRPTPATSFQSTTQ